MSDLSGLGQVLLSIPIWWLNGLLYVLYWLAGRAWELAALAAALLIAFGIDPSIQSRASDRQRRYGRGEAQTASPTAQRFTLAAAGIWLAVSLASQFPVPLIGALLWWIGLAAILLVSEERFNQLWWAKAGIVTYAALVLLLRLGLAALNQVSPADWASVVGSSADAQVVLNHTRSNVATIGMLFVFVLYPLGFAGLLLNRFFRNPKPLYNAFREAGDVLQRLRTRMD